MLPPKPNYELVETIPLKLKYDPGKKLNLLRLQSKKKTDLKNFTPPVKLIRKDPNAREYNKDNNNTFSRNNIQTLPISNSSSSSSITANITTTGGSIKNSQVAGGANSSTATAAAAAAAAAAATTTPSGADASLIAPYAGARQNKKMLFKKRTTQVFLADEETRKLKAEERLPWVLEDFGGSNTWVGQYCNTEDVRYGGMFHKTNEKGEKYVEFKQLSHWYEFKPKPKFTPLTIEEAEEIMGKAKKRENDRWFMRRSGKNDKEREMAEKEGGIYDNKSNLKAVENETDLIRSDDEGESKFHGKYEDEFEEMDYEQVFEDDEEDNLDLQNPEDVKDPVLVKTKFFSGTAEEEFEEDKERNKLTAEGKTIKKLVRTLEKNVAYDSDKESDPYASSVELDGTEDEEEGQSSQSLPSSLNSAKLTSPPKSEKGKSTTKSGAKTAQTKTKASAATKISSLSSSSSSSSSTSKSRATVATTAADKPKNKALTSAKKSTASSTPSSSAPATPNSTTTSKPKASTKSVTIKNESKSDLSTAMIGSPSSSSTTSKSSASKTKQSRSTTSTPDNSTNGGSSTEKKSKPAAGSTSSDSNLITEKEICVLIKTKKVNIEGIIRAFKKKIEKDNRNKEILVSLTRKVANFVHKEDYFTLKPEYS